MKRQELNLKSGAFDGASHCMVWSVGIVGPVLPRHSTSGQERPARECDSHVQWLCARSV